jgi:hypothetical protein
MTEMETVRDEELQDVKARRRELFREIADRGILPRLALVFA